MRAMAEVSWLHELGMGMCSRLRYIDVDENEIEMEGTQTLTRQHATRGSGTQGRGLWCEPCSG